MSPKHQLVVSVSIIAVTIAVAWVVLFRNQQLVPRVREGERGKSFAEISREFDAQLREFGTLIPDIEPAPLAPTPTATASTVTSPPESQPDAEQQPISADPSP